MAALAGLTGGRFLNIGGRFLNSWPLSLTSGAVSLTLGPPQKSMLEGLQEHSEKQAKSGDFKAFGVNLDRELFLGRFLNIGAVSLTLGSFP